MKGKAYCTLPACKCGGEYVGPSLEVMKAHLEWCLKDVEAKIRNCPFGKPSHDKG